MVYMLSASYVLYYFQDVLGVSAIAMGTILLVLCPYVHVRMRIPASLGVPPIRAKSLPLELLGRNLWTAALQRAKVPGQTKLKCLQIVRPGLPKLQLTIRRTNLFSGYQN